MGAFVALTFKLQSAPGCWHLDEATWLQVYITDQRAHLASRIKRHLERRGSSGPVDAHSLPEVRLYCTIMTGEKAQGQKRDGV